MASSRDSDGASSVDGGSGAAAGNHVTPGGRHERRQHGGDDAVHALAVLDLDAELNRRARGPGSTQLDLAVREEHRARHGRRRGPLQTAEVAERLVRQPSLEVGLEPKEISRSPAEALAGIVAPRARSPPHFVRSIT